MIEALVEFDKSLFLFLNGIHHPIIDSLMVAISSRFIWIPFYAYLLYVLVKNYRVKSVYLILFIVILVAFCDQFSVHFFKNVFLRLRPCHEPSLDGLVHIVNDHCGGKFGFVSSHASNVFGLAVFLGHFLKQVEKRWLSILLIWAGIVAYSRVYLGVHYPMDIFGGALLGTAIARFLIYVLSAIDSRYALKIERT